jgi:hypothetical protein
VELLLQILLFGALGVIAVSVITVLALWQTLRRRLRIDPRVRSVAPTHWHLGQHKAARAHRRLRVASKSALLATGGKKAKTQSSGASEFPAIAQSIVDRAVLAERDLVQAARMPRANRSAALQAPLDDVVRIEATVAELVQPLRRGAMPSTCNATIHSTQFMTGLPICATHLKVSDTSKPLARSNRLRG